MDVSASQRRRLVGGACTVLAAGLFRGLPTLFWFSSIQATRSVLEEHPSPDGAWIFEIATTDAGAMDRFHFDGTLVDRTGRTPPTCLFEDPEGRLDFSVRWLDHRTVEIAANWPPDFPVGERLVGDVRTRLTRHE